MARSPIQMAKCLYGRRPKLALAFGAAGLAVVGFGTGTAFAYFSSTGSGIGAATTGTLNSVDVVAFVGGDTVSTLLQPGATGDVILRVDNENAYDVKLVSITPGTISSSTVGCDSSNLTYNAPTNLPLTLTPGSALYHLTGAATLAPSAPSACQNTTFTIEFSSFQVHS